MPTTNRGERPHNAEFVLCAVLVRVATSAVLNGPEIGLEYELTSLRRELIVFKVGLNQGRRSP